MDLGFISDYEEPRLQLVFPHVVPNGIRANLVMRCGLGALQHNVSSNEDIRNLSGGSCDSPNCAGLIELNCLSVYYAGVCLGLKAIMRSPNCNLTNPFGV